MSEMALTAEHVIIVGRGRLLRDQQMAEFIAAESSPLVQVRSRTLTGCGPHRRVHGSGWRRSIGAVDGPDTFEVDGLPSETIGSIASEHHDHPVRTCHHCPVARTGLHDADRGLGGLSCHRPRPSRNDRGGRARARHCAERTVHPNVVASFRSPSPRDPVGMDQVPDAALVLGGARRRGRRDARHRRRSSHRTPASIATSNPMTPSRPQSYRATTSGSC